MPTSIPRRKPRQPGHTSRAILDAAERAFANRGLGGARVDQIAAAAGVNKRMIYHYFGSKHRLYLAVLEAAYEKLRSSERALQLGHLDPETAMRRLIEFNFDYTRAHPELIGILATENQHRARHLERSRRVRRMHTPLIDFIRDILARGAAAGTFRRGIDPVQLYITIAGIGYFYLSNRWTLSAIFGRDLGTPAMMGRRRRHNVEIILRALRPQSVDTTRHGK